jgi:predicted DNA-binding protein
MKGITIKLPESMLRQLRREARATGRSVAAVVRERLEASAGSDSKAVYRLTSDLAGSLDGSRQAATNERRRFRRA